MFLDPFYQISDNKISFSREQASRFAKEIADDFNPLHDVDAKRFCVPGDLLFSVILAQAGLQQSMSFSFNGMVSDDSQLNIPTEITQQASINDDNGKEYLLVNASGQQSRDPALIASLIKAYVSFSGHTFPHILVALMQQHQVMINPTRPMIMYESMSIELLTLDCQQISLSLTETRLDLDGKRGNACLQFDLLSDGKVIGHGKKHMLLSGLRPYCQQTIDDIVSEYSAAKQRYIKAA